MKKHVMYVLFIFLPLSGIFAQSNYWGVTKQGGPGNGGVVYKIDAASNNLTIVKSFGTSSSVEGIRPTGLTLVNGKLYGATSKVIFEIDPSTNSYQSKIALNTLPFFDYYSSSVIGTLELADNGKLYGVTSNRTTNSGQYSTQRLFEYDPFANTLRSVKAFDVLDYYWPNLSPMKKAANGKLYGVVANDQLNGGGYLHEYDPVLDVDTVIHVFANNSLFYPYGKLMEASDGKLYGTALLTGSSLSGGLFELNPTSRAYSTKLNFTAMVGLTNSSQTVYLHPQAQFVEGNNGKFYGITRNGGTADIGVIYEYNPVNNISTKLFDFTGLNGSWPEGGLMKASNGKLYGTTSMGGAQGLGVLFEFDPATNAYTKLHDFTAATGSTPIEATSLLEISSLIQVPPVVTTSPLTYCQGATAAPLQASGTNLTWYSTIVGGTGSPVAPIPSTSIVGSTSYFVSQTVAGVESQRVEIIVNVTSLTATPVVTTPLNYCQDATASPLIAIGSTIKWYTAPTGGTAATAIPTPSTNVSGTFNYYATQTLNGCESNRAQITVTVAPAAIPNIVSPVNYCLGNSPTALTATGTDIKWYTSPSRGTANTTSPTPSTTSAGTTLYYVSQTLNGCESDRGVIIVNVLPAPSNPIVSASHNYCQNNIAVPLSALGSDLKWYSSPSGGTGNATAPVPSTSVIGTTSYYVSQTINTCESNRSTIAVTVSASPGTPTVVSPVDLCQGSTASPLTATGNNLQWYNPTSLCSASTQAPVPSTAQTGSFSYYVSQLDNGCESGKATIVVNVSSLPSAPIVVSPLNLTQGSVASPLTATGTTLKWYNTPTGGTSTSAPTPSTSTVGTYYFYVSQTINGCESPRAVIEVIVQLNQDIIVPSCFAVGGTYAVQLNPSYTPNATSYSWWVNGSVQNVSPTNSSVPHTNIVVGQWYTGGQVCVGINYNQSPWYRSFCATVDLCSSGSQAKTASENSATDANKIEYVKVYPNPSSEEFTIDVSAPITEVEIKNMLGVTVLSFKEIKSAKAIQWSSLSSGMYVIQYTSSNGIREKTFIQKQ